MFAIPPSTRASMQCTRKHRHRQKRRRRETALIALVLLISVLEDCASLVPVVGAFQQQSIAADRRQQLAFTRRRLHFRGDDHHSHLTLSQPPSTSPGPQGQSSSATSLFSTSSPSSSSSSQDSSLTAENGSIASAEMNGFSKEFVDYQTSNETSAAPENTAATASESASTSSPSKPSPSAVIVLNVNARQVTPDLAPMCQEVLGEENVYLTTSNEEAIAAAKDIAERKPRIVIPVGGDGTLTAMVNHLCNAIQASQSQQQKHQEKNMSMNTSAAISQMPLIAYIPLGTGNGAGSVIGCIAPPFSRNTVKPSKLDKIKAKFRSRNKGLVKTIAKIQAVGATMQQHDALGTADVESQLDDCDIVDLHMMQVSTSSSSSSSNQNGDADKTKFSELAFFAGVGFDSLMLQDFKDIQAWTKQPKQRRYLPRVIRKSLSSVAGYCVALVSKTLPKCILNQAHEIQVKISTRQPESTLWIDHRRGDVARSVSSSGSGLASSASTATSDVDHHVDTDTNEILLYKGKAGIVAAGTAPYYGGGLRLFPFACMHPNKMHLRVGRIHPIRGFLNIPKIFSGEYRDKNDDTFGCIDFIGPQLEIEVSSAQKQQEEQDGYPLQHSGESIGIVNKFQLEVVENPVRFITFMSRRPIEEAPTTIAEL